MRVAQEVMLGGQGIASAVDALRQERAKLFVQKQEIELAIARLDRALTELAGPNGAVRSGSNGNGPDRDIDDVSMDWRGLIQKVVNAKKPLGIEFEEVKASVARLSGREPDANFGRTISLNLHALKSQGFVTHTSDGKWKAPS